MLVIKIGGGETINIDAIIKDLKTLTDPYVIIHGGNFMMDTIVEKFGIENVMLTSQNGQKSRYTDQKIIDCMLLAYSGYMNKTIVFKCQKEGINAIGLSGLDGKLILGTRHKAFLAMQNGVKKIVRDDMTGTVEKVNVPLVKSLIKNGYIPVITPPVMTFNNEIINVDGDKIAFHVATALKAKTLLFFIEKEGFLKDMNIKKSLITNIKKENIDSLLIHAQGRMKKKLLVAKWALSDGVKKVYISDGRIQNPIKVALSQQIGTLIQ